MAQGEGNHSVSPTLQSQAQLTQRGDVVLKGTLHLGTSMTSFLRHFGDSGSGPVAVLPAASEDSPGQYVREQKGLAAP